MKINYEKLFTNAITSAELVYYGPIKGTLLYAPNGWAIWERIQNLLNLEFKKVGVRNVNMPMLIPESMIEKEKAHIAGFKPELFKITQRGEDKLSENWVVRPTSEVLFADFFAQSIKNYRDLPVLVNQWVSVMRDEKNTRPFLRGSEFHWQEGHTCHIDQIEAFNFAKQMITIYEKFAKEVLLLPVLCGEKTEGERFPGAKNSFTIEAIMPDGMAVQSGTSHYLGTTFSKPFEIKFQSKQNSIATVEQTSWGVSTRLIGSMIMTHSDEKGLMLPFVMSPIQILVIRVAKVPNAEIEKLVDNIKITYKDYEVKVTDYVNSPGPQLNYSEKFGVPISLILGEKELSQGLASYYFRTTSEKKQFSVKDMHNTILELIKNHDSNLWKKANNQLQQLVVEAKDYEQFKLAISQNKLVRTYFSGSLDDEKRIKKETLATPRCIVDKDKTGVCFFTGQKNAPVVYFAKSY